MAEKSDLPINWEKYSIDELNSLIHQIHICKSKKITLENLSVVEDPVQKVFACKDLLARILSFATLRVSFWKTDMCEGWLFTKDANGNHIKHMSKSAPGIPEVDRSLDVYDTLEDSESREAEIMYQRFDEFTHQFDLHDSDLCLFLVCKQFCNINKYEPFWKKCYKLWFGHLCPIKYMISYTLQFTWRHIFYSICEMRTWDPLDPDVGYEMSLRFIKNIHMMPYILTFYTYYAVQSKYKTTNPDKIIKDICTAKRLFPAEHQNIKLHHIDTNIIITGLLIYYLKEYDMIGKHPIYGHIIDKLFKQFVLKNIDYFIYNMDPFYNLSRAHQESDVYKLRNKFQYLRQIFQARLSPQYEESSIIDYLYNYRFINISHIERIYELCGVVPSDFVQIGLEETQSRPMFSGTTEKWEYCIKQYNMPLKNHYLYFSMFNIAKFDYVKCFYELGCRCEFALWHISNREIMFWLARIKLISREDLVLWHQYYKIDPADQYPRHVNEDNSHQDELYSNAKWAPLLVTRK